MLEGLCAGRAAKAKDTSEALDAGVRFVLFLQLQLHRRAGSHFAALLTAALFTGAAFEDFAAMRGLERARVVRIQFGEGGNLRR